MNSANFTVVCTTITYYYQNFNVFVKLYLIDFLKILPSFSVVKLLSCTLYTIYFGKLSVVDDMCVIVAIA